MPFFDTHTHLDYLQQFTGEPLSQLVDNAKQADPTIYWGAFITAY